MKKTKRITILFLTMAMAITMLAGCGEKKDGTELDSKAETHTVVDVAGDTVELPVKVEKVVNLVPFECQIMIGLGLGDCLIGISEETIETPWLEVMYPRVKEITTYSYETDVEAILAVNSDVVLCEDVEKAREFRSKGINAVTVMYYSIDDFKKNITLLGDILGEDAKIKCNAYLAYFDGVVADVDAKLRNVVSEPETMYYINGNSDKGFYKTCGAGSTNDAIAKLSYAELATNSLIESPTTKVDAEAILSVDPQNVIIGGRYQHVLYDEIFAADEWSNISAVREGHVFKVPMSMAAWNRYSIEVALMIPWTASVLYPENYKFDAVNETISFYRTFTGYELTEEQANYILEGLTPDGEKEIASR